MAGKFGPGSVWFLLDGYNVVVNKLKSLSAGVKSEMEVTTGLGDTARERTPIGVCSAELVQEGAIWDTTTNYIHTAMVSGVPTTPQTAARVACLGFAGQTVGESCFGFEGDHTVEYEVKAERGALQKGNVVHHISGQMDKCLVIQELAAKTADWDTTGGSVDYTTDTGQVVIPITSNSQANPSVVTSTVPHGLTSGDKILVSGVATSDATINGAQIATVITSLTFSVDVDATTAAGTGGVFVRADSAGGAVGYLQVTAAATFTNFVAKIQDSPDDAAYSDLITFTDNVSAPFAERVAASGDVDRYLAVDGDITGAGSITACVICARL
jgi:hypothetical protein